MESVIVALITGGLTLMGTVISVTTLNSKTLYRIEQLEKKMDKHNSVIERTFVCEKAIDILDEKVKNVTQDIEELKEK